MGRLRPGPALRCRWAGPAARPAALAALGSRPRRARRAGLGLRGGAGTGSGKQQCGGGGGGGGGGALPLQEPSAGRRAGAAASRDCGPRRPHGRRGGESRRRLAAAERQARGADLPREGAPTRTWDPVSPCVLLPQPHPGLRPRFTALPLPLAGSPLPSHGPQREPCFPGPQSSPIRAWCAPPAPLPAHPTFSVRAFPSHASDAPFSQAVLWGARPASREWPSIRTGTRAEEPAVRGGGRGALRSPGAGRAPWFPPRCGAQPGNLLRPGARPTQGQKSAQSWPVFPPPLQNGTGPGGRGEAGARVRLRFRERNRQVGVYFQKRRGGAGGVRQVSARGVPVGGDLSAPGQPSPRAGPHFLLQALNCPKQTRPEKCEAL